MSAVSARCSLWRSSHSARRASASQRSFRGSDGDALAQGVQLEPVVDREIHGDGLVEAQTRRRGHLDEIEDGEEGLQVSDAVGERVRNARADELSAARRAAFPSAAQRTSPAAAASAAAPGLKREFVAAISSGRGRFRRNQRVARSSRILVLSSIASCVCAATRPSRFSISSHRLRRSKTSRATMKARAMSGPAAPVSSLRRKRRHAGPVDHAVRHLRWR